MGEEIELKLSLPQEAHRAFLRHPLLKEVIGRTTHRLTNIYYDTPELHLRQNGIALRLRRKGRRWLQTIKCAGNQAGGLSTRPEWETAFVGHFEFGTIEDETLRDWLTRPKIASRLQPVFETHFQRSAWLFERADGTRIEVALDRGWIAAAGSQEPISEVELELIAGDATELFSLAMTLAEHVPLFPQPVSKADRGYALFQRQPPAPVRAEPVSLTAEMSPLSACRTIALACLDQLQRNHAPALIDDDAEYIHQMRVALRRLRAALRLFRPLLPNDFLTRAKQLLRELMMPLGRLRDHDVLLSEIVQPVLKAMPEEPRLAALVGAITERRQTLRQQVVRLLASPRYGAISLELLALVHRLPEMPSPGMATQAPCADSLSAFAARRLKRLHKKALALAEAADANQAGTLHALRIGIKRLRYALDFLAPLAGKKRMRRLLKHLAALQDTLGQINDLANAGALLNACAGHDGALREAVSLIAGWHGPRYQKLLASVPDEIARLSALSLPHLAESHDEVTSVPYAAPSSQMR